MINVIIWNVAAPKRTAFVAKQKGNVENKSNEKESDLPARPDRAR